MTRLMKIWAIALIAMFLAAIPLVFADTRPEIVKVVYDLRAEDHYAKGSSSANAANSAGSGYSIFAKWTTFPVNIEVDTSGIGLDATIVLTTLTSSGEEWDKYTSKEIFGLVKQSSGLVVETDTPDRINEIVFGSISNTNIIAQTTIWYNRFTKVIVDFDMVFNTYWTWGDATTTSGVMDLQNIATHELGHGFGLADLYQSKWSEQTMYGYASIGETKKRTLASGDSAGIQALYGK
ncbi:MAG: matrixin family metalloprotease [Candidatus Bathyarchaeota archaeon]|nr:matrixin family metalloprotease [Candidatus Bathyarchaeota archaeon]